MKQITFQLETLTPMFMSGANQGKFELRPPSFKGLLRFWWRAYYWGNYAVPKGVKKTTDDIEKEMAEREGEIFGIASDNGQKSKFSVRLTNHNLQGTFEPFPKHNIMVKTSRGTFPVNILEYLAYGTHEYQKQKKANIFIREYLPTNKAFSVILNIADSKFETEIIRSFYLLSVFGAIGSKSHNGFGNFAVKNSEIFHLHGLSYPFPDKTLLDSLSVNTTQPRFSAFSRAMKVFKLKQVENRWDRCLAELGKIYRSSKEQLEPRHHYHKRQYIGAPITVNKKNQALLERRAKPYFIRVIKKSATEYDGYILYLPSTYCEGIGKADEEHDKNFQKYCEELNDYFIKTGKMEVYYECK